MEEQRQYVGIDLHRRRSVLVRMAGDGTVLETVKIENDPVALAAELAKAEAEPEVAMEATLGWYGRGRARRVRRPAAGRPAWHGAPARGLDRPAGDPRAA